MPNKFLSIATAIVFLFSVSACGTKKETQSTPTASSAQNVTTFTAKTEPITSTVTYTGEIQASESVSVISKLSAIADNVYYNEGDYVTAGSTLAVLDKTDVSLAYDQALASYNSTVANYNMISNSTTKQASASAQQNLSSAQVAYNSALTTYNREKRLYDANSNVIIAKQRYDDAVTEYDRQKELFDNNTSITAAQNTLTACEKELERVEELFKLGAASQLELDTAKNNATNAQAAYDTASSGSKAQLNSAYSAMITAQQQYNTAEISASAPLDAAESALKTAETALSNAKENIGLTGISTEENISTASANVESARAGLATAQNALNNATITAPISGYISYKNITKGQLTGQGVEVFTIKNASIVNAEISVTESVIPFITEGTQAQVLISSISETPFTGNISLVNTVKNPQTGMYTVKVSIENKDNLIKVGMFADVTLTTGYNPTATIIHSDSIMQQNNETYVYVANGNTAEKRNILTGIQTPEYTEILSGIAPGEIVVVSGKEYLSDTNNQLNVTSREDE